MDFQVDILEGDAFEVLRLVRCIKNSLAPISRIPPEVLSLVPDYYRKGGEDDEDDIDQDLITLTHVCRSWRDTFTSRSSLWARLDFANVDKTRTYIQRSQSSPLKLHLADDKVIDDAFALVIPHIHRLKSLIADAYALSGVLEHFCCHAPLLGKLDVYNSAAREPALDSELFGGDLSSLRELRLHGVTTHLPWNDLANLRIVDLKAFSQIYRTAQMLDFFESAPLLHTILLRCQMLDSSDAPPERIVPLRHLKVFNISTSSSHSTLLHHLRIPAGASLISKFHFIGGESPLLDYLPERSPNFSNLSHITAINLLFGSKQKSIQLSGPSGSLRVLAEWEDWPASPWYTIDHRILRSFGHPMLSTIQGLAVSEYEHPGPAKVGECPVFQMLSSMNDLRTLILIESDNLPFTCALDPGENPSNPVLCFNMEELVFYVRHWFLLSVEHLVRMAKNRASRGAKLSSITLVDLGGLGPEKEVSELREHVTNLVYRVDRCSSPAWDDIPGDGSRGGVE